MNENNHIIDIEQYNNAKCKDLIDVRCKTCNKTFQRKRVDIQTGIRQGRPSTSCPECVSLGKNTQTLEQIECLQCHELFLPPEKGRKFCSQHCSSVYNNTHKIKKIKVLSNCLFCNKSIRKNGKYCNASCQAEFETKNIFIKIEQNIQLTGSDQTILCWFKKYLIHKHGNKCMLCGWDKINIHTNKVPIEIDHIDGNCENNILSNFQLVCPNCHSLTKHYKGGNSTYKDRGQKSKRYLQWVDNFSKGDIK